MIPKAQQAQIIKALKANPNARAVEQETGSPLTPTQILRAKWPKAFPANPDDVRPLASGIAPIIAQSCGWSAKRTKRVLEKWKQSPAYHRAVTQYEKYIKLDGTESEEKVKEARRAGVNEVAARLDEGVKCLERKWPKMFPANRLQAPPLGKNATKTIAKTCGWSLRYARRVVRAWRASGISA